MPMPTAETRKAETAKRLAAAKLIHADSPHARHAMHGMGAFLPQPYRIGYNALPVLTKAAEYHII